MSSSIAQVGLILTIVGLGPGGASAPDPKTDQTSAVKSVDVYNPVSGWAVVAWSKPEGALVNQGHVVLELDTTMLKGFLPGQERAIRIAAEMYVASQRDRQAAESALTEYLLVTFEKERKSQQENIERVKAHLKRAEERLEKSDRLLEKNQVSRPQNLADKLEVQLARFQLEQQQTKLKILLDYTKGKTVKELTSKIDAAKVSEARKQAAHEREQAIRKRLIDQIEACKVLAPADGRVHYMRRLEGGSAVEGGERLFRVITGDAPGTEQDEGRRS